MARGKAETTGGLSPAKDNNEATRHFIRRTLPIPDCVDNIQGLKQELHFTIKSAARQ